MTHSTVRLFADTLGKYTQCEVLLPDRPEPGRPVPALYLLHGLSDDQSIWMSISKDGGWTWGPTWATAGNLTTCSGRNSAAG